MLEFSAKHKVMLMGGVLEKESTSIYCTLLTIANGKLLGRHRKIKPTYEERLVWADGDSKGVNYPHLKEGDFLRGELKVYDTKIGKSGGLNCWENWLPLARAALHRMGEIIHVAVWPGSYRYNKVHRT